MNTKTDGISSGLVAVRIDTDGYQLVRLSDAEAIISQQADLLEEQKGTITALNIALGGDDSTSTENLIDASEVDYSDEGLILLCRKLTIENVRLNDVVEFQKKAWAADHEDLTSQISELEASPMSEEALDILRSVIAKQSAALKMAKDAIGEVQDLIGESHGVYGLHLNGDESPWGELEQGGRFERLTLLNEALAAIDALEGE